MQHPIIYIIQHNHGLHIIYIYIIQREEQSLGKKFIILILFRRRTLCTQIFIHDYKILLLLTIVLNASGKAKILISFNILFGSFMSLYKYI